MSQRTLRDGTPREAGLDPAPLRAAAAELARAVAADELTSAAFLVARDSVVAQRVACGAWPPARSRPALAEDIYLVASLTKPIVALLALQQVADGRLELDAPAHRWLPALTGDGRERITLRHLLTHTSGLPDQLPENEQLRAAHAPLSEFVARAMRQPLAFLPGRGWQYQSMGLLLLATIVEQVSGTPLPELLEQRLLQPLGLADTCLGVDETRRQRLVPVRLPPELEATDWHWNSDYWRALGAPWGGLHSTLDDLAVLLAMMLGLGAYGGRQVLPLSLAAQAVADQTSRLLDLPDALRRRHRWGLGWRLAGGSNEPSVWPTGLSPRAFGHTGATGTFCCADPETDLLVVLLTNEPASHSGPLRSRVAELLVASAR